MRQYKIAFVGLGSIGRRHLRNLTTCLKRLGDRGEIDLYRSGHGEEIPEDIKPFVSRQFSYTEEIRRCYDIVFVTNPTIAHYETLNKFKGHTKSFFIEKPIFDHADIDLKIFDELKDTVCYVACPLRQHPVIAYIKQRVNLGEVISARAISSSYLPDWRPGQDYRKCFCSHRDMGGGVGIDLIHEWDYLTDFFGMPKLCYSIQEKISNLEIDSDDIALYIAKTKNTTIELHLDYFGRQSIRTLDLYMQEETIHCDLLSGTIAYLKEKKTVVVPVERDAYQIAELEHFLHIINHKKENDNTMEHALEVLKLAKGEL